MNPYIIFMKRLFISLTLISSMLLAALAVYKIILYSESRSMQIFVCDKKVLITSEPGIFDYLLAWASWIMLAVFLIILVYGILSSLRRRTGLKSFIREFKYAIILSALLLLCGLLFTDNVRSAPWEFFINGKENTIESSHRDKSFTFTFSDIECCRASVETRGRHRFLEIHVTLRNYPRGITGGFTWHSDRGLLVFSHGAGSMPAPSEIADEINTKLSWYNISTNCR